MRGAPRGRSCESRDSHVVLVTGTFDLKYATRTDYQNAYLGLETLGLHKL